MKLCTLWQLPLKVSAVFYGLAAAQVHLSNVNTTGLSATCIAVLQQSIACDPLLLQVGFGRFETDATLSTVCTSSCATALTTYIRRINGACGTTRYDGGDGYFYLAPFAAESAYERYQTTCLQNSSVILSKTCLCLNSLLTSYQGLGSAAMLLFGMSWESTPQTRFPVAL